MKDRDEMEFMIEAAEVYAEMSACNRDRDMEIFMKGVAHAFRWALSDATYFFEGCSCIYPFHRIA